MSVPIEERKKFREKTIKQLQTIRRGAYSHLTCHEYDAIKVLINYLKFVQKEGYK